MSSLFDHLSFDLPMPSLSAASASGHVDEVDDRGVPAWALGEGEAPPPRGARPAGQNPAIWSFFMSSMFR